MLPRQIVGWRASPKFPFMRPIRALLPALRHQPPSAMAREVAWRLWKPYRAARLQSAIQRGEFELSFRQVPYYQPDLPAAAAARYEIVAYADLICSGQFPLLGYATAHLGFPPAWNRDFVTGFEWEHLPAAEVMPVVRQNGSDVKTPWELSRLQFLPVLIKAHLLTGAPRYRHAAIDLVSDWQAKNPVGIGVNWTLAMESALRGMSLCFTLSLMQPLLPAEEAWGAGLTRLIWQHLLYTESRIEFSHLIRGNHYLGNLAGLHCMATFLDGPGMERRRQQYRRRIEQEIFRHVYSDGGDYEASFSYHLLVLQMFTSSYLLMRADRHPVTPAFTDRLKGMFDYLAELADKDGRVPHVGDSDDGRVELLATDLRQMLSLPLERRDSLLVPGYIALGDALFDLGVEGDPADAAWHGLRPEPRAAERSRVAVFSRSGVAIARKDVAEVVFCAIPNGIHGAGSHSHNDKLSLLVRLGGWELLCDSGTCFYTRDPQLRNQFRSTAAHNTIVIDGAEQNDINPGHKFTFCIGNQAAVTAIELVETSDQIHLCASHSGYSRLGVEHHRCVSLRRGGIAIDDILEGTGSHSLEIFWHLPSTWRIEQMEKDGFEIAGPQNVCLTVDSELELQLSHQPVPISRTYGGALEKGTRLRIAGSGRFPCTIRTHINW